MHRFDISGRKLGMMKDHVDRGMIGRLLPIGSRNRGGVGNISSDVLGSGGVLVNGGDIRNISRMPLSDDFQRHNTSYGLSPQFLKSLNIRRPLINRIFVTNLDSKVDEKKLKEVFKLAGRVLKVEIFSDNEGKSKGYGVVEYNHTIEAVQAISMFNNQFLFDSPMSIRFDHTNYPIASLPEGLKSIGISLGAGVERNLRFNAMLPIQSQPLSAPVNTNALDNLCGLSLDGLDIESQNRRSSCGVIGLGKSRAGYLGIETGCLGASFRSGHTSDQVSMNSSYLHQDSLGGRDFGSISAPLGVQGSNSGVGASSIMIT